MINDYEQFNLVCGCAFSLLTHTDIISKPTESAIVAPIILKLLHRVGQGFWVFGIQGCLKSGIRYIAA